MIGIFDSGLGGLTVARAVMEALPSQRIIYFGDTARWPYGNKTPAAVTSYAMENTKFLLRKKAKAIVVGCNTASAVSGMQLRRAFPEVPIFEVVSPAAREALRVSRSGKIGVIGTRTTVQSGAYRKWLPNCTLRACPLFVPLVEGGRIGEPATLEIATQYLASLKDAQVDTLILGCTHYPFLKPVLARVMGPHVKLVDSAETVASDVSETFKYLNIKTFKPGQTVKHEFYVSKKTPKFQELAEKWLGQKIALKLTSGR